MREGQTCADSTSKDGKPKELPRHGEDIWWQAGKIFFDHDRQQLVKVAYSHAP
jgi:hypothetical protein